MSWGLGQESWKMYKFSHPEMMTKDYLRNKWTMFKKILSSVRKCFDLLVKCGKMRQKTVSIHGMCIVSRNITKKLTDILHQFSKSAWCKDSKKLCSKLRNYNILLSYQESKTANFAPLTALFCPVWLCPKKIIMEFKFLIHQLLD